MITLRECTLRRGVKVVLDRASVVIQPGEKVGLVGRNGAGKSSLFSLLTGRLQADAGDADIPARWIAEGRVAEVAQEMPEVDTSATRFVLEGDNRLMRAEAQLAAAEASDDGHAIADAHAALADASAFDAPARAQALLLGLGFKARELDAPVNSFSGGWRMRLQLARALMCPADLLLLDEPTNHLDLDALVWLEAWLGRFDGTMFVISHDREFLDAITEVTVHLDEAKLMRYGGNYTAFETMRAERLVQQQQQFERQQERMAHLQKFIDRFKAKATKARQAQSRVKALARMEKLAPVLTASDFAFEFREPANLPNPMLAFDGLGCGYRSDAGEATAIVRNVSRSVLAGQRIGILGANGQGKSTLVKTVARALPPLDGRITEGKGLTIGYFAQQELDVLSSADGPLMHLIRIARDIGPAAREQELRDFLGSFRFVGEMVTQPVGTMSGGEKARLVLAMLVWQRPNLLLLDEPTNHLDLTTREALSMALNEFEGTVMLVSHDRALLRETCDEFWLVAKGRVEPFDGDLDDYQRWLLEQSREAQRAAQREARGDGRGDGRGEVPAPSSAMASAANVAGAQAPSPAAASPAAEAAAGPGNRKEDRKAAALARQQRADRVKPLKREMNLIDHKLGALHAERDRLETALADGSLEPAALADHGRRLKALSDDIGRLETRWLELGTEVETLEAEG
jgi:ATP-binding cassette, subfamily F, member 3